MRQEKKRSELLAPIKRADDRIAAAYREFAALLARHQVRFGIESGESSEAGKFLRLVFFDNAGPPPTPPAVP